jgi:hypothetical protein
VGKHKDKAKNKLEARIKTYEIAKKSSGKGSDGYTKPGSQNPKK